MWNRAQHHAVPPMQIWQQIHETTSTACLFRHSLLKVFIKDDSTLLFSGTLLFAALGPQKAIRILELHLFSCSASGTALSGQGYLCSFCLERHPGTAAAGLEGRQAVEAAGLQIVAWSFEFRWKICPHAPLSKTVYAPQTFISLVLHQLMLEILIPSSKLLSLVHTSLLTPLCWPCTEYTSR